MDSIKALQTSLERAILDPHNKPALVLLKAIRNGAVYGAKVRFPHALVMTLLFRSGPLQDKFKAILKATRQHGTLLAKFVFLYKASMLLLRASNDGKEAQAHSFLAGLFGGYWVFGHGDAGNSGVNQQIVIYVAARVVLGLAKMAVTPSTADNSLVGSKYGAGGRGAVGPLALSNRQADLLRTYSWPVFASLSWAGVMWLFENYPDSLQPSLRSSMVYLYSNAEKWDSPRNFLWHNK